jgi:AmiR/NasT family two-component response regulator
MNETKKTENQKQDLIKPIDKNEVISTLEKAIHDFNMVDNLVKQMLNNDSVNQKELMHVLKQFDEASKALSECAKKRNETIMELLKLVKN